MARERRTPEFARGLPKTRSAVAYARRLHADQARQVDGAPFILHPLEVAALLHEAGATDDVVAAGVLHDTLEKTDATETELSTRFGPRVAALVRAVTEDDQIRTYAERKADLRDQVARADAEAAMVFAADKLSKVRELLLATQAPVRRRKLTHYRRSLALLQDKLPGSPLVATLEAELGALGARVRDQQEACRVR